jgi:hypothetical protein
MTVLIENEPVTSAALITFGVSSVDRYDAACRAVAEAKSIDEVKDFRDKAEAMRAYARQARNRQLEIDAAEIRFRAERRIGELMAAQRDAGLMSDGGRPREKTGLEQNPVSAPITLSEAGIDKNLADRARKYAAIPQAEFDERLTEYRQRVETEGARATADLLAAGGRHARATLNTGEFEWYTPQFYVDLARQVLGEIDLDPASSHVANRIVGATTFFSMETNGLAQPWTGRVWMNPPYAQPAIADFSNKLVAEFEAGTVSAAIVLTNDCTDTVWFHRLATVSSAFCFTRGRVRFVSPGGDSSSPTQGQAFFYIGHDPARFAEVFAPVGLVVQVFGCTGDQP